MTIKTIAWAAAAGLLVSTVAACTTQPAMAPDHVSALKSGEIAVVTPARGVVFVKRRSNGTAAFAGFFGGAIGVAIAGAAEAAQGPPLAARNPFFKPYGKQIERLPVRSDLLGVARSAASDVAWIGGPTAVKGYHRSLTTGEMQRITQENPVNATAFMQTVVFFSPDLRKLEVAATMSVFAHGSAHAVPLDGGRLLASTTLAKTTPELSATGVEAIAASKRTDKSSKSARAEVWLAHGGARFRQALHADLKQLQAALVNYLNGRRSG